MLNRLIKNFTFDDSIRAGLAFSDSSKVRLNTENKANPKLELKKGSNGLYSTATNITVTTPLITPQGVKKWLKFEALVVEDPTTFLLPSAFSLGFKVKTTAGDYWWNGAAWAIAGATDWSTESQLNTNFSTFPIAAIGNKSIGFVVNLRTTDPKRTPEVKELKLLGDFDVEWMEDLIYDGIIRKLNTGFRSSSVLSFQTSGPTASVDLTTVLENKGYNITAIRSVYNVTDDPLKLNNLFQSYAPGAMKQDGFTFVAGTVTLSSSVPADKVLEINFEYVPEVSVMTGQDFFEVPAYPSLVFETIQVLDRPGFTMRDTNSYGEDIIRDKSILRAVQQIAPKQFSVRFQYSVFTNSQLDQMRLTDDLIRFFSQNKTVKSYALDCEYGIQIVEELDTSKNQSSADTTDTNIAEGSFDVLGVLAYHKPSIDVPLIGVGKVNIKTERLLN